MSTATVTSAEFDELKASVLFSDDDVASLRRSGEILADRVEDVLDVWYGFVGSNPHLLASFTRTSDGEPSTSAQSAGSSSRLPRRVAASRGPRLPRTARERRRSRSPIRASRSRSRSRSAEPSTNARTAR